MQKNFYLTEKLPPYIFSEIHRLKVEAASRGVELIDFGMGNPDSAPPQHVMDKLSELTKNPKLFGYSTTGGIEILKKSLCGYYARRFGVELDYARESLVTIGAKEGIASLVTAISDDKNYTCVPSPSYPIHTFAFALAKSKVQMIDAISAKDFLANFKKHQIYIISDIAYCELYFDEKSKPHSILEVKGAKDVAIEFSSISKSYSMAGCRVGFAAGNKNLIAALYKIKSYLDYGSFNPLQIVAAEALTEKSDEYLKNLRALYKKRGEFFVDLFSRELRWEIEKPKASMFVWTKIPSKFSAMSSFDFCKKMIEEVGVAMTPGSAFGRNGEGFVRFSMIHGEENMRKAVVKMKAIF